MHKQAKLTEPGGTGAVFFFFLLCFVLTAGFGGKDVSTASFSSPSSNGLGLTDSLYARRVSVLLKRSLNLDRGKATGGGVDIVGGIEKTARFVDSLPKKILSSNLFIYAIFHGKIFFFSISLLARSIVYLFKN